MGVLQAQMSLKYCVARTLIDGELSPAQFSDHKLSDPQAIELASHVNFILDEEINRIYPREFPSIVEIIMKDGTKTMTRVDAPKGSIMHPMSWSEVQDKFKSIGTQVIGEGQAKALVESIEELENLSDVSEISKLMMV
jgi:2-methylcitrate dehydratase PrpD